MFILRVQGPGASEAADLLRARLREMAADAGVSVVCDDGDGDGPCYRMAPHDTAEFAADKMLDLLAGLGVVDSEAGGLSEDEERAIRQRLTDLGYLE